jgi:hypothetical protein
VTLNQKRLQKKLARKAAKRKQTLARRDQRGIVPTKDQFLWAASVSPIHECLVPERIFDLGIGNVIISRRTPDGSIAAAVFLVDLFCLGVKDCFFMNVSRSEYEARISHFEENETFQEITPEYARKLVEGAVGYASTLGFPPHKDYQKVKKMFGNIDPSLCPEEFEFGKEGKAFYVSGPNQTEADSRRIIRALTERFGPDGFHFMVGGPLGTDPDDE